MYFNLFKFTIFIKFINIYLYTIKDLFTLSFKFINVYLYLYTYIFIIIKVFLFNGKKKILYNIDFKILIALG